MELELEEWKSWIPPEEAKTEEEKGMTREELRESQKNAIVAFLKEKIISYPSEISRELGISRPTVYDLLWELVREGRVKRHYVPKEPCECFRKRLPELWKWGIKGRHMFSRIHWFTFADNPCDGLEKEEEV